MTLKVAILYTGESRTIEKTLGIFKKHVLEGTPGISNINIHVFAVLQGDTGLEPRIRETMGNRLKSLEWFDRTDPTWKSIQRRLLNIMPVDDRWKSYLENSGSMIEYYQLYLAYSNMCGVELSTNTAYDFVMRIRPDIVINKPIDFSVFSQKQTYYTNMMDSIRIRNGKHIDSPVTKHEIYLLMNALLDPDRNNHITHMHSNAQMETYYNENAEVDDLCTNFSYDALANYIRSGQYVISLRKNVVYLANRTHFERIAGLGMMYGMHRMPGSERWFDAESQFETACIRGGFAVFNSTTTLEDKSLYEYNSSNYFEGGDVKANSAFLFFICRE
uniref:Uncharacterized protein n=1 Tax=viral metagenome TaxID=1070528 RepID=A0A6C0D6K5_9ZZZZ